MRNGISLRFVDHESSDRGFPHESKDAGFADFPAISADFQLFPKSLPAMLSTE